MPDFLSLCTRTESQRYVELNKRESRLLHAGMGLVTEAGEFLDALKKCYFYGKEVDLVNLREELGDILWYMAIAMDALGTTFEEEMDRVIRKLRRRYPSGFSDLDALDRDLDAERKELEA